LVGDDGLAKADADGGQKPRCLEEVEFSFHDIKPFGYGFSCHRAHRQATSTPRIR
jgi:hypothetical protein